MTPKIIRTVDELAALDPDAVVTDGILTVAATLAAPYVRIGMLGTPAVVVATGDTVRAARQALAEAPTDDFHSSIGLWQQPPATWEEA
jgi:hypothetical protein